jgi:2-octaprenylphenol hydroxylase
MKKYDVVIMGGGMTGLSLAALLAKHDFAVAVVESGNFENKESALSARVSAMHLGSQQLFAYLDCWSAIKKFSAPLQAMKVWDHTHQSQLHFDSRDIDKTEMGWIAPNQMIVNALHEKLSRENKVDFFLSCLPRDFLIEKNHVHLTLNNNEILQTPLIVGADGAHSWVRKQMPIHTHIRPYYQKAIVATIESELPHDSCAYQQFLKTGPVALLPLQHTHHTSLVWSADDVVSDALMQKPTEAFNHALTEALDFKLGKLTMLSERKQFPLIMRHADEYVADHFALAGDAAHTIHPLAGLGANLGLMDAACLTQVLIDARTSKRPLYTFQTLRRYTRWRKSENEGAIKCMRILKEIFAIDDPWFNIARSTGFNTIDQSDGMKSWLMQIVTGNHDDQPGFLTIR